MTVIILVTDQKQPPAPFRDITGKNGLTLTVVAASALKKLIGTLPADAFVYLDASSFKGKGLQTAINSLLEAGRAPGICDIKGTVEDPALLIFDGAADYLGKSAAAVKVNPARMKKVLEYAEKLAGGGSSAPAAHPAGAAAECWDDIEEGKDYPFCMMYIELDHLAEMKRRVEAATIDRIVQSFHDYLPRVIAPLEGRIWIWGDYGGLILFPGEEIRGDVIMTACRLVLYRRIISVEEFDHGLSLSFRIAIHVGETTYQCRGETGTIVSDSINSIFHLGSKFARPGNLYVTREAAPFIPPQMADAFIPAGEYEGREILRMKLPHWDLEKGAEG
jgi:hypothetical protein